jgi:hypothetical protein
MPGWKWTSVTPAFTNASERCRWQMCSVIRSGRFNAASTLVQGLRDEDLYAVELTRAYGVEWVVHDLIEGDTYEHYQDHITPVRAWLDRVTAL